MRPALANRDDRPGPTAASWLQGPREPTEGAQDGRATPSAADKYDRLIQLLFERFLRMELIPERPVEIAGCILRGPRDLWVRLEP